MKKTQSKVHTDLPASLFQSSYFRWWVCFVLSNASGEHFW